MPEQSGRPAPEAKKPDGKKLGCGPTVALILLGAVLVLGVSGALWTHWLNKQRQEFCLRAERFVEDVVAARPSVPHEDNAAPLYQSAFLLYVQPLDEKLYLAREMDQAAPADLDKYLADNAPYLTALRKAAAKPACDFGVDISAGRAARLHHYSPLRTAERFLAVAARAEARAGRPAEALDLLTLMLRVSRDAESDGLQISLLYKRAFEHMIISGAEFTLNESDPSEADIAAMIEALTEHQSRQLDLASIVRTDAAMMMATMKRLVSGEESLEESFGAGSAKGYQVLAWRVAGMDLREAKTYEARMEKLVAVVREKPCWQFLGDLEALEAAVPFPPEWTRFNDWIWWDELRSLRFHAPGARTDLTRLAFACRLYKLKTGKYPEKLAELSTAFPEHFPKLPVDPFNGKSFGYQLTESGCKLWSVGKDRVDDGGLARDPNKRQTKYDRVFELKK